MPRATYTEISTSPGKPFSQVTPIDQVSYTLKFRWNHIAKIWVMDILTEDEDGKWMMGIPLVTGCDLLEQFGYLPMGAQTMYTVMTIGPGISPDMPPDFNNLGIDGHLYISNPVTTG